MTALSRRHLLAAGGALVVRFVAPAPVHAQVGAAGAAVKAPAPDQLSSWLAVQQNGDVVAYFGKVDVGQGVEVAIAQIVAEELDVPFDRVQVVMGDTARTVNQGGASGSTGIERGAIPLRFAAAEARRVLLDMAASRFGVPAASLAVREGVVVDGNRGVSYGELIGGRDFDVALKWNGELGNGLTARGVAAPKAPSEYRLVGTSVPRADVTKKVFGTRVFVGDIRVPRMLHGRMVRPPVAGATVLAADEASVAHLAGVRVVRNGGFLGVVAPKEWDAIRAAGTLAVTWSDATPPFPPHDQLHAVIRAAPDAGGKVEFDHGDVDATLAAAGPGNVITAEYEWPFQSHASMAPACAVADVRADGITVWTATQKPHYAQIGVAGILGRKKADVHVIWTHGPGSYGRNDAGDAAIDAAVLSAAVGAPVRLQGMRHEGTGWDPKGPASVHTGRAVLDANGRIVALDYASRGFSRTDVDSNESDPRNSLAGQMTGRGAHHVPAFGTPEGAYEIAVKRLSWQSVAPLLDLASPLRSSHLRDPVGPQLVFGYESFIDEVAYHAGADAVAFRLRHLTDPHAIAVIEAAAQKAGWETRVSSSTVGGGEVMSGRGIAYAQRGHTLVAIVAEVQVDRTTGRVQPIRYTVAHDCGLIVNPDGLRLTIEGNILHATSRGLHEEVMFDERNVTSVDWETYPILDVTEAPRAIDIVLIDHPDKPPLGAGEASTRPLAAALANAIFDATGVRLRRAPFTADRVRTALASRA
jgi:nicotinate dehydrogenase subunit B